MMLPSANEAAELVSQARPSGHFPRCESPYGARDMTGTALGIAAWALLTGIAMAKSGLALASRYAELVNDARLRKKIFAAIEAEWHLTADALTLITGEKNRLAHNAALARSIRHRFPYIDPLHHLQVELVRRYREGKADDRVQRGIHISINVIAAGLRNTG